MPLSFLLHPQEEVERTSIPDSSPSIPPPIAPAPPETVGPSSISQEPPEHIPSTSRDFLAILDAVTALTERMARAEVTLVQNQAILLQIQSQLGLQQVISDRAYTTHYSRPVSCFRFSSLVGGARGRRNSFRSTSIYTTCRVRWSHFLL